MNTSYCAKGNLSNCKSVAFETPKDHTPFVSLLLVLLFCCCCYCSCCFWLISSCSVSTWLLWCSRCPASRNTLALELDIYPCLMHLFTALLQIASTFGPPVACACGYHSERYHCFFFVCLLVFFCDARHFTVHVNAGHLFIRTKEMLILGANNFPR